MDYSTQSNQGQNQSVPPTKPRNIWNAKLITLVVGLIIIGVVIYGTIWYSQKNQVSVNNPISADNNYLINQGNTNAPKEGAYFAPPVSENQNGYMVPAPNAIVQWNVDPKKIEDVKLILGYRDDYYQTFSDAQAQGVQYYDMGKHNGNNIILAIASAIDPSGPALFFFEKKLNDGYIFMQKMSSYGYFVYGNNQQSQGYVLSSLTSSADTTTYYYGIVGPANVIWKGLALEQSYLYPSDLFKDYVKMYVGAKGTMYENTTLNKVDSLAEGDLYLYQQTHIPSGTNQSNATQKFYVKRYILKLKSGLFTTYDSKYSFFSDNLVPNITWLDGTKNQDTYRMEASLGGCGNPGAYVVSSADVSGLVKVSGTASNGESIYEFKDSGNPVQKFFYDLIEGKIYDYTTGNSTSIPYREWASHHPVIFYKNAIGEYAIFTNNKYGVAAECGKPVIYLYPTKTTHVKVQVGADITKSEPEYNKGWEVQANPDGSLKTVDGKIYDSLFWEGIGHGIYPSITEGFIVKQSQIKTAITSQLKELGLNEKESSDFLEFWLPKMPTTPHVRLTWFTNSQLNELAPLVIWPIPDTSIRVFLDFQGLQNNISLPLQNLTSLPRKGFTVVEWGGLLRK